MTGSHTDPARAGSSGMARGGELVRREVVPRTRKFRRDQRKPDQVFEGRRQQASREPARPPTLESCPDGRKVLLNPTIVKRRKNMAPRLLGIP